MMINEAFDFICSRVQEALEPQGFSKLNVSNAQNDEMVSLYANDAIAYSVIYYSDKQRMVLESCGMTDDGPDNDWKALATWMFDPETNDKKDANSIANDFVATVSAPVRQKAQRQQKRKKRDEDGNVDPVFMFKRLVTVIPELKEDIFNEEDCYDPFRSSTFAKTSVVPKVNNLLSSGNRQLITKLGAVLNAQYKNGDMDCRSIITIVILNGIEGEKNEKLMEEALDEMLLKAWKHAKRYRGKTVKPEKPKKPSKFQQLAAEQNNLNNSR
ncbi:MULTISPECIES: hypothetical protein [unclassified Ruminococcus]|uniref:DUF7674 family protein n=1 Tax=unclassified Ruminococcus TaxID=2608920 RepID=UPI00210BEF81|nr:MULTISPECIES: hypothetical protein [unclassified Ruminococcus]MCQ4021622.1 hypothetical protein [Ruminococcus sp. zg-924]MCQ4114067.1 hypothetical protein [Ruminococcus sp. zg-921]